MPDDLTLEPTPFLATGDLATVAPSWVRHVTEAPDPESAASAFFEEHTRPVAGPTHLVDGVHMVEVSFLHWASPDAAGPSSYLLLGGLQGRRVGDLAAFTMQPVGATSLRQITYLLPEDGIYSYSISTPEPADLDAAQSRARLGVLWQARGLDERSPDRLLGTESSFWQGPDFPCHPAVVDRAPQPAEDLRHLHVDHADGRRRDVWLASAASRTARTVVLFDGDVWRELGVGAEQWRRAGHDANLVLMSSMEQADRTADLTDPGQAAATLSDVLAAVGPLLGATPSGDDVVLVGQSFGGLAVVSVLLHHPEIARSGVCISGSFHYRPDAPLPQDFTQVGAHRESLAALDSVPDSRLVLLSGRDEPIAEQSLVFLAEARAQGLDVVAFRQLRGGHDYAWWRHAIFHGLDALELPRTEGR